MPGSSTSQHSRAMEQSQSRRFDTRTLDPMPRPRAHEVCADCVDIFIGAASLLLSSAETPPMQLFDAAYQTRLIENAASSKCHMCVLLQASIPRLRKALGADEVLAFAVDVARHDPRAATVRLVGCHSDGSQEHHVGSLRIQDVGHGHVRSLQYPTWSLETLGCIRAWMRTCASDHDCPAPCQSVRLPQRLIDVMATGSARTATTEIRQEEFDLLSLENLPGVRIIGTAPLPQSTPYLTLSHRWGNPPSILLTEKTLFLLSEDISPHLLRCDEAAVFRHAVHVARALGFRYVWIDALCIMQDDGREKMREIMRMDEIYSNSTLNIAATEGRVREGLAFERRSLRVNPCRATVRAPGAVGDVCLQAFPNNWFLGPADGELNRRGWVFQERMLAARIVHFTRDQVFWECHSSEASEVLPWGVPGPPSMPAHKGIGVSRATSASGERTGWYDVVEEYSRTSLTFPGDRLLAVSALAKRHCMGMRSHPSQYLAGMWAYDLPLSLLWRQNTQPEAGAGGEVKTASSWSWASILAPVQTVDFSTLMATAEVLDVQIARASPNYFDGATSCRLRLRGQVCRFRRRVRDGVPWLCVGEDVVSREFGDFSFQRGKAIILYWDSCRQEVADRLAAAGGNAAASTYSLLHVTSETSEDGPMERGIILLRVAVRGNYVRVGSFFTPFQGEYQGSKLEDAFAGRLATLSEDDYLEVGPAGRYVIDII